MKEDPLTPQFWRHYLSSLSSQKDRHFLSPGFWDQLAERYEELENSPFYCFMVEEIIKDMQKRGALCPSYRLLDVACGPGNYACRFAPLVKDVVALDISPCMLKKCHQEINRKGLKNIKTILADWFSWKSEERFDTVFASMTPILHSPHTIERLVSLARHFLVIVHWAGKRKNLLYEKIWKEVFSKELKWKRPGIIVIFNYLYTLGFPGDLRFFEGLWERSRTVEEEWEHVMWRLEAEGISPTKKQREKIMSLLKKEAWKGKILSQTEVRIGYLIIEKKS